MKILLLSDIFVLTGFGLIQPILAIYINGGNVIGSSMLSAGLASALFLFTKSVVQLPFGHYIDKQSSKTKWLILGTFLMASVPIIYIVASTIYHVYLAEMIYGLGSGLAYPTWLGLWSANLDKGRESFQWSVYSTSTGLGTAATGAAGAAVASLVGFNATFIMAGMLCMLGCLALIYMGGKSSRKERKPGHRLHFHSLGLIGAIKAIRPDQKIRVSSDTVEKVLKKRLRFSPRVNAFPRASLLKNEKGKEDRNLILSNLIFARN